MQGDRLNTLMQEGLRMMREAAETEGEGVWKRLVETILADDWDEAHGDPAAARDAQVLVYGQIEASFG